MSGNKNSQPKRDPTCTSIESPIYPTHLLPLCGGCPLLASITLVQAYDLFFDILALGLIIARALPVFWGAAFVPKEYNHVLVVYEQRSTPSTLIY